MNRFVLFFILLAGSASAQTFKDFAIAQAAVDGIDAFATYRNSTLVNFQEHDSMARPFVTHGPVMLFGYFAADATAKLFVEHELRKHHHEQIARVVGFAWIADNTYGLTTSFRGHK
jgi:hypothetical protein